MEEVSSGVNPSYGSDGDSSTARDAPESLESPEYAITVRHAAIQYKDVLGALLSGTIPVNVVLKDFNMTVQKGHIYGLLGASGCGKTSILRAMMGQIELTAGEIRILGQKPSASSGIPGTTVGYMPQDLCLLEEFSIEESLFYFGRLGGMAHDEIQVQCDYLVKLLHLPEASRIVSTLSGGQQRRVSFAIALLYSPPVLILDEPTVGVDPLLRESIWDFLTKLVKTNGTTVLITTHYIEEATLADTVGLIRHGKLMAEQNPFELMRLMRSSTLEDVLLKLCLLQSTKTEDAISAVNENHLSHVPKVKDDEVSSKPIHVNRRRVTPLQRLKALLRKDALTMIRHYWFTLLVIFFGPFETYLYGNAVGRFPVGIRVSAFNQELNCENQRPFFQKNPYSVHNDTLNCELPFSLSCRMLAIFENQNITVLYTDSENTAKEHVRKGRAWAALTFGQNFTSSLMARASFSSIFDVDDKVIDAGAVGIAMDQSDRIVSLIIQDQLIRALKQVMAEVDDNCHNLKHVKDLPIQYLRPIYGNEEITFGEFGMPGLLVSQALMLPLTLAMSLLLPDKVRGTLERSLVVGATMGEITLSQFIVCLVPVALIIILSTTVPYFIMGMTFNGDVFSLFVVLMVVGILGMLLGYIISILFDTVTIASLFAMGFYFTCFFASGTIWPAQGAHPYIQWICWIAPLTVPTAAIRHIAIRGWSLANWTPKLSILNNAAWTLAFLVILLIMLRLRYR